MNYKKLLLATCIASALQGCGSDSNNDDNNFTTSQTGIFMDAPVEGLYYDSPSFQDYTDSQGRFNYASGELITFYIGDLVIGQAVGSAIITPLNLVPANQQFINSPRVLNILRLLQTLDEDPNDNIIEISAATAALFKDSTLDLNQPFPAELAESSDLATIINQFMQSHPESSGLVSSDSALTHFQEQLVLTGIVAEKDSDLDGIGDSSDPDDDNDGVDDTEDAFPLDPNKTDETLHATTLEPPTLPLPPGVDTGRTIYVRGLNDDWGTTHPMTFENGLYTINIEVAGGREFFKFADADWNGSTNCGVSPEFEGVPMPLNTANNSVCSDMFDGLYTKDITIEPEAGNYTFVFSYTGGDGETGTAQFIIFENVNAQLPLSQLPLSHHPILDLKPGIPAGTQLYLRGIGEDWGTSIPLEWNHGIYTTEVLIEDGQEHFKIANADWTAATNCGVPLDLAGVSLSAGRIHPLICGEGDTAAEVTMGLFHGLFLFGFRYTEQSFDTGTGQLLVLPTIHLPQANDVYLHKGIDTGTTMYVRGIGGDWGTSMPLTFNDGIYSTTLFANGKESFRIADSNWTAHLNCGIGAAQRNPLITINTNQQVLCPLDFDDSSDIQIDVAPSNLQFVFSYAGTDGNMGSGELAVLTENASIFPMEADQMVPTGIDTGRTMFLRGIGGDWGTGTPLVFQNGIYSVTQELSAKFYEEVQFTDADWSPATTCGVTADFDNLPIPLNQTTRAICAGGFDAENIIIEPPSAGNYHFSFSHDGSVGETAQGWFHISKLTN